ncbi:hypothetical protein CHLNCDRAFT_139170 [Chlorella variabilis]|uniref:Uncharacterized protein n=1 Tax=Chlorella variabilis TaxID=554065 RepID=E1ZPL3_CHLVA|nr:hypothetical protein CHLNCDRAFT_139170 [Chlorella variabilis]EFN52259.1 hypothetical protein CHLNCDRAFT_139170 [Chlorella variabilis]|eukprot:XP_005844361.1 hypothetical protein CHLNCDRAFT_139170 [Chlorella variabilis]
MSLLQGFASVNTEGPGPGAQQTQTLEAQESRIISSYEHALSLIQALRADEAEASLRQLLAEPLVEECATDQLHRIKFLALKNLGDLLARRGPTPGGVPAALAAYCRATEVEGDDAGLWNKLGTLASGAGYWAAARSALERGLELEPSHPTMPDKLLQLLLHVGDTGAAAALAAALLRANPRHAGAAAAAAAATRGGGGSGEPALRSGLLQLPAAAAGAGGGRPSHQQQHHHHLERPRTLEQPSWQQLLHHSLLFLIANRLAEGGGGATPTATAAAAAPAGIAARAAAGEPAAAADRSHQRHVPSVVRFTYKRLQPPPPPPQQQQQQAAAAGAAGAAGAVGSASPTAQQQQQQQQPQAAGEQATPAGGASPAAQRSPAPAAAESSPGAPAAALRQAVQAGAASPVPAATPTADAAASPPVPPSAGGTRSTQSPGGGGSAAAAAAAAEEEQEQRHPNGRSGGGIKKAEARATRSRAATGQAAPPLVPGPAGACQQQGPEEAAAELVAALGFFLTPPHQPAAAAAFAAGSPLLSSPDKYRGPPGPGAGERVPAGAAGAASAWQQQQQQAPEEEEAEAVKVFLRRLPATGVGRGELAGLLLRTLCADVDAAARLAPPARHQLLLLAHAMQHEACLAELLGLLRQLDAAAAAPPPSPRSPPSAVGLPSAGAAGPAAGPAAAAGPVSPRAAGPAGPAGGIDVPELRGSLEAGVLYCLYWLYGLQAPGLDEAEEWGGDFQPKGGAGEAAVRQLTSRAAVAEVWPLVEPLLLQDIEQLDAPLDAGGDPMQRLLQLAESQGVPGQQQDASWRQAPAGPEPMAVDGPGPALGEGGAVDAAAAQAVRDDDEERYGHVYRSLFHLLAALQDEEAPAAAAGGDGLLGPGAEAGVDAALAAAKLDLCWSPARFASWERLAVDYHAAADDLLNEASGAMTHREWKHSSELPGRVRRWRRLAYWATAGAWLCAGSEERRLRLLTATGSRQAGGALPPPPPPLAGCLPLLEDALRLLPWQEPLAGGASWQAAKRDPAGAFHLACSQALHAFDRAEAAQEAEEGAAGWDVLLSRARCARKLQQPAAAWLPLHARACRAAAGEQGGGGVLLPLYALHAARMRLLLAAPAAARWSGSNNDDGGGGGGQLAAAAAAPQQQREQQQTQRGGRRHGQAGEAEAEAEAEAERQLLRLVGSYCFLPATASSLRSGSQAAQRPTPPAAAAAAAEEAAVADWRCLLADCCAAMRWCLDRLPSFHPAAHRKTLALYLSCLADTAVAPAAGGGSSAVAAAAAAAGAAASPAPEAARSALDALQAAAAFFAAPAQQQQQSRVFDGFDRLARGHYLLALMACLRARCPLEQAGAAAGPPGSSPTPLSAAAGTAAAAMLGSEGSEPQAFSVLPAWAAAAAAGAAAPGPAVAATAAAAAGEQQTPGAGLAAAAPGGAPPPGLATGRPYMGQAATPHGAGTAAAGGGSWRGLPTPATAGRQQLAAQLLRAAAGLDAAQVGPWLAKAHQVFTDLSLHTEAEDRWRGLALPAMQEALRTSSSRVAADLELRQLCEVRQGSQGAEVLRRLFSLYAGLYVHLLQHQGDAERLLQLLVAMKKRVKSFGAAEAKQARWLRRQALVLCDALLGTLGASLAVVEREAGSLAAGREAAAGAGAGAGATGAEAMDVEVERAPADRPGQQQEQAPGPEAAEAGAEAQSPSTGAQQPGQQPGQEQEGGGDAVAASPPAPGSAAAAAQRQAAGATPAGAGLPRRGATPGTDLRAVLGTPGALPCAERQQLLERGAALLLLAHSFWKDVARWLQASGGASSRVVAGGTAAGGAREELRGLGISGEELVLRAYRLHLTLAQPAAAAAAAQAGLSRAEQLKAADEAVKQQRRQSRQAGAAARQAAAAGAALPAIAEGAEQRAAGGAGHKRGATAAPEDGPLRSTRKRGRSGTADPDDRSLRQQEGAPGRQMG